jgi:hypothetical protein
LRKNILLSRMRIMRKIQILMQRKRKRKNLQRSYQSHLPKRTASSQKQRGVLITRKKRKVKERTCHQRSL